MYRYIPFLLALAGPAYAMQESQVEKPCKQEGCRCCALWEESYDDLALDYTQLYCKLGSQDTYSGHLQKVIANQQEEIYALREMLSQLGARQLAASAIAKKDANALANSE